MGKIFLAAAAVLTGLATAPAGAMPLSPVGNNSSIIELAANGCGAGWYRDRYGRCHRMGYVAPVYLAPVYGVPVVHPYYRHCWWRAGVRVCR